MKKFNAIAATGILLAGVVSTAATALCVEATVAPAHAKGIQIKSQLKPRVRVVQPRIPVRIDTGRLAERKNGTSDTDAQNGKTQKLSPGGKGIAEGGPQPEPPTDVASPSDLGTVPLPSLRPDTALPEKDNLFDEDLVAQLPGIWGNHAIDIREGFGEGAIDRAFENPPVSADPFKPSDNSPGDLAGFNPEDHIQPGGPNDPAAGEGIPSFFENPLSRDRNDKSQGWSSPSQAIGDPRGKASDGSAAGYSWWEGRTFHTTAVSANGTITEASYTANPDSGDRSVTIVTARRENGTSMNFEKTVHSDGSYSIVGHIDNDDGTTTYLNNQYDKDGNLVDSETRNGPTPPPPDGGDPAGQPGSEISPQERAEAQAWICNNTPWMCRPGSVGATPFEMLTQPSQGTGSIMGSGDGPDLGREAVTNTGDASFNTERTGTGGGGGGGGIDYQHPGDPEDPDGL